MLSNLVIVILVLTVMISIEEWFGLTFSKENRKSIFNLMLGLLILAFALDAVHIIMFVKP
jgi:hypothetical protein